MKIIFPTRVPKRERFSRLTTDLKLKHLNRVPSQTPNLIAAIILFASWQGLEKIPSETIKKLNSDPYFIYCFVPLCAITSIDNIYRNPPFIPQNTAEKIDRLKSLLKDPNKLTEEDLCLGLTAWMNNFSANMPGGDNRDFPPNALSPRKKDIFEAINHILEQEKTQEEHSLLAAAYHKEKKKQTNRIGPRLAYLKFCLNVFDQLRQQDFSHQELWT